MLPKSCAAAVVQTHRKTVNTHIASSLPSLATWNEVVTAFAPWEMDGGAVYWGSLVLPKLCWEAMDALGSFPPDILHARIKPGVFQPLLIWIICRMQPKQFLIHLNYIQVQLWVQGGRGECQRANWSCLLQVVTFINLLNSAAASRTGWVQKGLYSAALECVFDSVSSSSSERNGCATKGLSIVLQDVKCPLLMTCGDLLWFP